MTPTDYAILEMVLYGLVVFILACIVLRRHL